MGCNERKVLPSGTICIGLSSVPNGFPEPWDEPKATFSGDSTITKCDGTPCSSALASRFGGICISLCDEF